MTSEKEQEFLQRINENSGIAHKVANIYFQDHHDREDMFQEMMYQLWKAYESFDSRSKFSTWMYRVCLNIAITFKRKSGRIRIEVLSAEHGHAESPIDTDKEEALKHMFEAIGTLSPLNKAIILLYLEDLSYDEISSITGLSKSNVGVRLVRIKKELEEKLSNIIKSLNNVNL